MDPIRFLFGQMQSPDLPDDPTKYPRVALVRDDEAMLTMSHILKLSDEERALQRRLGIVQAERHSQGLKLFARLEDTYPDVSSPRAAGARWFIADGHRYYVSYDADTFKAD
jgi:hypothetical protein